MLDLFLKGLNQDVILVFLLFILIFWDKVMSHLLILNILSRSLMMYLGLSYERTL